MDKKVIKLEEKMMILQDELSQMSHEVYAQQKEVAQLVLEMEKLKSRLKNVQPDSHILTSGEDVPPPHY